MKLLLSSITFIALFNCYHNFVLDKDFSLEITPLMATNETLIQNFKCNPEAKVSELTYYKHFPAKISCNDWSFKKMNTSFNITIGDTRHDLQLRDINTILAHVNGQLILMQSGPIEDGICAGGKFEKLVFNKVDPKACDKEGAALQTPVYASVKIEDGFCEAFCFGEVTVEFSPGITNA